MIEIGEKNFDLENYKKVVYEGMKVRIAPQLKEKVRNGRNAFLEILKKGKPIYSVNTGVGKLADVIIPMDKIRELQKNIIRSHAIGWGEPAPCEIVRGTILLRLLCLSKGFSGVSTDLIDKLAEFLNKEIIPFVPLKGSVGASGDLAPLSFIALSLTGEGYIIENGDILPAYFVLKKKGIKPYELKEKEGIALINGIQFSLSLLIHAFLKFEDLLKLSFLASLFSFVVLDGDLSSFDPFLGKLRNSEGQVFISKLFKKALKDYRRRKKRKNVQAPYTLRCIPQIIGTILELRNFIKNIILMEMNSVSDNPVIKNGKILYGGNFHGQRLSFGSDIMAMLISTLSNFSERRIFQLMGVDLELVPRFLAKEEGLSSGYMLTQVMAAALASYNKALSFPHCVDTIPTSLNQEDFVSMSTNSALRLFDMLENLEGILLTELICGLRAVYITKTALPPFLLKLYNEIMEDFKIIEEDHFVYEDIKKLKVKIPFLISKVDEIL